MTPDSKRAPTARPPVLVMSLDVLKSIALSIGVRPAESGGAIGGEERGVEISHYHFDTSSRNSAVTYTPDHEFLNGLFKEHWNPAGIRLRGFVHSHPGRHGRPSSGDEIYAERILEAIDDLENLWLPIVNTVPDSGEFLLTPWLARRAKGGVSLVRSRIKVVKMSPAPQSRALDEFATGSLRPGVVADEIRLASRVKQRAACSVTPSRDRHRRAVAPRRGTGIGHREDGPPIDTTFDRVKDAYDLSAMHASRIIAIGAGGAASWLEELARAGLGQFVLIDGDVVSESNLATQQAYRRDIGRPKVDCIAERIRDIHPSAKVLSIQKNLDVFDDEPAALSDEAIEQLAFRDIDGREAKRTIIAGLTDNFFAQARTNRLALNYGLPSLSAQVYKEGRGAEVTFTYPGVTPACHRCILSSRYQYFLEQRQENDVTSDGTPIFSTSRLNALKGVVMLALLHHESSHPRWGNMLRRIGERNLLQIRMDPDFAATLGMSVFDRVFDKADQTRLFFDEAVWLPQEQECLATGYAVPCPDCGGTGDLRDAIGTIADTRLARPRSGPSDLGSVDSTPEDGKSGGGAR